jgi:hypothetical protein
MNNQKQNNPLKSIARFRLIYDRRNNQWLFVPLDFWTVEFVVHSQVFFPWPINGRSDTWRLSQVVPHGSPSLDQLFPAP